MHARGQFEVDVAPRLPGNPPGGASELARLSLDKRFRGDLEGVSHGEMLAFGGGAQKDGAYVAMECVTGTLGGREGSFVLAHRSLLRDGVPEDWSVTVAPGSGTGALAGIEGGMKIRIENGRHEYEFDYLLPR